ncbi:MAG TPA: hypothetical protein VH394_21835, partial [Thermoanaerobaculia bacterium]|nr:hypothetical protein [Thermoanaerobaculia bacterium]
MQCKLRGPGRNLKPSEIKSEAIKAEGFEDLGCLIIATTSRRDTVIQRYVRRLSKEWEGRGLFSVHIFAWDDIVDELHNYEDLVLKYYLKPFDRFDDGSPAESLVSIGAPRSETGLGDLESGEGSESWVLEVRAAVDRQDYAALRQMVVKFQGSEVLDTSQQSEFSLYSTLLAYHDGNLSDAQEILARSGPNASSEARIRTALWLLQVGRVAEARFLVDLEINPSSPVVNILAEAVRIWASLSTSISIGTRVRIEEVDELAQSASMVDAPATL